MLRNTEKKNGMDLRKFFTGIAGFFVGWLLIFGLSSTLRAEFGLLVFIADTQQNLDGVNREAVGPYPALGGLGRIGVGIGSIVSSSLAAGQAHQLDGISRHLPPRQRLVTRVTDDLSDSYLHWGVDNERSFGSESQTQFVNQLSGALNQLVGGKPLFIFLNDGKKLALIVFDNNSRSVKIDFSSLLMDYYGNVTNGVVNYLLRRKDFSVTREWARLLSSAISKFIRRDVWQKAISDVAPALGAPLVAYVDRKGSEHRIAIPVYEIGRPTVVDVKELTDVTLGGHDPIQETYLRLVLDAEGRIADKPYFVGHRATAEFLSKVFPRRRGRPADDFSRPFPYTIRFTQLDWVDSFIRNRLEGRGGVRIPDLRAGLEGSRVMAGEVVVFDGNEILLSTPCVVRVRQLGERAPLVRPKTF